MYSGNVVDICPVGALTDRDFRFQCRVWFLGSAPSVCPGCSRGCNIEIHYNTRFDPRYHDKRVHRLKPRHNPDVNGYWMCDEGRYQYHRIDAPDRLRHPLVRERNGAPQRAAWNDALAKTAAALRGTLQGDGPDAVAVLASPQMTNEELFRARQLFRDELGVKRIAFRVPLRKPVYSDDFLVTADKNPNSRGAEALDLEMVSAADVLADCAAGRIRFLYVLHHDLELGFEPDAVRSALGAVAFVVYQGSWDNTTAQAADVVLPAAVYAEKSGTFTNVDGRVQRIEQAVAPLGESLPDLDILAALGAELGHERRSSSPSAAFLDAAAEVPHLAGLSYELLGRSGRIPAGRAADPER
jgi:NADH-quinone oxidoreductase subunit G